ncbi:MAG: hypothetical protein ACOYKN_18660 [Pirellula sp.]
MSSAAKRPLRCMVWFWLSFVLVLSPIGRCSCSTAIRYSKPAHRSQVTANRLDHRSASPQLKIAAAQTAIEYEYRFTEYEHD